MTPGTAKQTAQHSSSFGLLNSLLHQSAAGRTVAWSSVMPTALYIESSFVWQLAIAINHENPSNDPLNQEGFFIPAQRRRDRTALQRASAS
jgi:hypothetical protein